MPSNTSLEEGEKRSWSNLSRGECPKCERKLSFRLKGSTVNTKTRANRSSCGTIKSAVGEDYYFCFRCKLQITKMRMNEVVESTKKDNAEFAKKLGLSSLWL